jgi:hypothetical protein
MNEAYDFILETVLNLMRRQVDWHDLVRIQQYGANYKSKNYHLSIFGERLKEMGKPAVAGDRLEYVIVQTENPQAKVGDKMMLRETYLDLLETEQPATLDYHYYVGHVLANCIDQLFGIGYSEPLQKIRQHIDELSLERLPKYKKAFLNKVFTSPHGRWLRRKLNYTGSEDHPIDLVDKIIELRKERKSLPSWEYFNRETKKNATWLNGQPVKRLLNLISIKETVCNQIRQGDWQLYPPHILLE